jgi:4-aminobutyrate aminotransferase-like enzyme
VAQRIKIGDLGTTFGGSPLACAALLATLQVIEDEDLAGNAARVGEYLKVQLGAVPYVEEVRGRGLLLGLKIAATSTQGSARVVQQELLRRRILTGTSDDPQVLRLMPPLVLSRAQADQLLEVLLSL